jgi:hypothetical protein
MSMHEAIEMYIPLEVQSERCLLQLTLIQEFVLLKRGAINFDGWSAVSTAAWQGNNLPI